MEKRNGQTLQGAGGAIENGFINGTRWKMGSRSCYVQHVCYVAAAYQSSGPSSVALSMVRKYVFRLEWWSYMRAVGTQAEQM